MVSALSFSSLKHCWDVFLLFAVPIGGGIPAGVVLAQSRGIGWGAMLVLYFLSDVALAIVFEPLILFFLKLSERIDLFKKIRAISQEATRRTIARYGHNPGPIVLILIAFGVDPMTGRAAALSQGHNFVSGWAIAIAGDMIFFAIVMASTIWLNNILGDGTWAAVIIMVLMFVLPPLFRKIKNAIKRT